MSFNVDRSHLVPITINRHSVYFQDYFFGFTPGISTSTNFRVWLVFPVFFVPGTSAFYLDKIVMILVFSVPIL